MVHMVKIFIIHGHLIKDHIKLELLLKLGMMKSRIMILTILASNLELDILHNLFGLNQKKLDLVLHGYY